MFLSPDDGPGRGTGLGSLGKPRADLLVTGIGQLVTAAKVSCHNGTRMAVGFCDAAPKKGKKARELGIVQSAAVAVKDGLVICAGAEDAVKKEIIFGKDTTVCDAGGRLAAPGFVDAHTHLVFGGWRAEEYAMRCQGKSYLEIAAAGGGIAATVKATRAASSEELLQRSLGFLDNMILMGTTTCEAKSGYGLDCETEIKQLRVLAEAQELHPVDLVPTFLGAHAIPQELKEERQTYVRQVIKMLPLVKKLELALFVDVFCDAGAFTVVEAREILSCAKTLGFGLKLHADELAQTGATELGCKLGAASCDHLLRVSPKGIADLAGSHTVGVLLPATSCYLGEIPGAPARELLDSGAAVALGSDFNPGTSTAMSMPLCMTLACSMLKMTPEEVWVAATWNAACASGLGGMVGALAPGFLGDIVIFDAEDYREIPYRFGTNLVNTVIKRGTLAVRDRTICKDPGSVESGGVVTT